MSWCAGRARARLPTCRGRLPGDGGCRRAVVTFVAAGVGENRTRAGPRRFVAWWRDDAAEVPLRNRARG